MTLGRVSQLRRPDNTLWTVVPPTLTLGIRGRGTAWLVLARASPWPADATFLLGPHRAPASAELEQ